MRYYYICMGLMCISLDSFTQSIPSQSGNARIRDMRTIERLLEEVSPTPEHPHPIIEAETLSEELLLKNPECQIQIADAWLKFLGHPDKLPSSAPKLNEQIQSIQRFIPLTRTTKFAETLHQLSLHFETHGSVDKAITCSEWSAQTESKDHHAHQKHLNQLGYLLYQSGQYFEAAKTFRQEIKWCKRHQLKVEEACALNNLGSIYVQFQAHEKALSYFEKSMAIRKQLNDQTGLTNLSINIGSMHVQLGQLNAARKNFDAALIQATLLNDPLNLGVIYCNLAEISIQQMNLEDALKELRKAIGHLDTTKNQHWLGHSYEKLGRIYLTKKQPQEAIKAIHQALKHSEKDHNIELSMRVHETAYKIFNAFGNAEHALDQLTRFVEIRDSLDSSKALSEFLIAENQQQVNETSEQLSSVYQTKLQTSQSRTSHQKFLTYSVAGGLIFALILGFYLYTVSNEFKQQRNQLQVQGARLSNQHVLLSNSHKEIKDSIVYAQRIQNAILPYVEDVREVFPKSFMMYQPKDVVAGDFYWIQAVDDSILFAVADCTGHGVPGAMVSVICINALNRCVREHHLSDPAAILNKTQSIVIDEFEQAREEIKDGMDIALCKIQGNQLTYAGANNPVWILHNWDWIFGKPARQPIGKYLFAKPFKNWTYELESGDKIYLFSDGFPDQFGGQKGKKLKKSKLKEWLSESAVLSMDEQGEILQRQFDNWKGNREQVDDVCLFGVEI